MASLAPVNGSSPAEQLRARHAANTSGDHHVLVEDAIDEDDIQHPPPPAPGPSKTAANTTAGASLRPKAAPLNVNSEEAFPSLGPSKAAAAPLQTWSRKPVVSANGNAAYGSSAASKGKAPTQHGAPLASRPAISSVSLPGRSVERISFAPHQITPRNQLKRTVPEILREINRKYKAKVEVREGTDGHVVFEGTGTQEAVRQALKEVANQLGSKQSIKIPVPLSVRSHVIGRQGATIQGISKRSGAKINIPKHDATPGEDDDDATIDITVEGDAVAAELARQDIQKIINERTSNASMRLKEIPPEFYPFLAGPRQSNIPHLVNGSDVNITIPHYHTWEHAPPAQAPSPGRPAPFAAQQHLPIKISGDRVAAQEAREKIERQVEVLRRQLTSYEIPIERGRHQFIVGPDGDMLHDFVAETGCSIVMPPSHDESEILYIIGPGEKIDDAVNKVMDIAASMSVSNVDVARQHARAPPNHAHQISRYLQERRAIAALERQFGANVILPQSANSPANWQIFSRDGKQCMKARAEAMGLIAGHPPSRFHSLQVNPFFHSHLQSQATQIRRDQGVHLLFPPTEDPNSHELVLVYEQPGTPSEYEFPRQAPSPAQVQEIQRTIQQVVAQLLSEIGNPDDVVSQKVEAPPKYHEKIQRYVDREQRKPQQSQIPAQLVFGRQGSNQPGFNIRGRQNDVTELNALIEAFIEQEKKDELERGFTTSFEFPHKHAGHLVGKKGDSIKKLQDEFDVEINYTEGKVELKGPQAKTAACKSHILSLAKKLDDEATHTIKVPPQYHGDLKGQKGSQVLRLQERYNVRINFPRAAQAAADDDAATEASFRNYPTQAPDVVIIKGPKKGADEAKEEILNLLQYAVDHSHSGTVLVSAKQIPSLIGSGGRELDALRVQTGAAIDMPKKDDINEDGNGRVEVKIKGTKQQVEAAKKLIQERAKTFDDIATETLQIDPKFYKTVIGPNGATLTKIVLDAGGPDDRRAMNRMITFPKQGAEDGAIKIQGPKAVVAKIKAAVLALVSEKEGQVTETMTVPPEQHRHLIGPGGSIRRKIESDTDVEIMIPRTETTGPERSIVTISGKPENIAQAKSQIESLLKEQSSTTIDIPVCYHNLVSDEGNLFRRLRNDHGVNVDHAGQKPPPKSAGGAARGRANGTGALPLITDDPSQSSSSHSWELVDHSVADADTSATIPWVLRGNADKISKARKTIEQALQNASKPNSSGYLILSDPKLYRFVIGPQGSTVNNIRNQTGTQITVPRQGSGNEAIEVKGPKDGVEKAKDLILEAVNKSGSGGGPRRRD